MNTNLSVLKEFIKKIYLMKKKLTNSLRGGKRAEKKF